MSNTTHNVTSAHDEDAELRMPTHILLFVHVGLGLLGCFYFAHLKRSNASKPILPYRLHWPAYFDDYGPDMKALLLSKLRSRLVGDEQLLWHGFEDREAMKEDPTLRDARNMEDKSDKRVYYIVQGCNLTCNVLLPTILVVIDLWYTQPAVALSLSATFLGCSLLYEAIFETLRCCSRNEMTDPNAMRTIYALTDRRAIVYYYNYAADMSVNFLSTRYVRMAGLTVFNEQSIFYASDDSAVLGMLNLAQEDEASSETETASTQEASTQAVPGGGQRTSIGFRFISPELARVEALLREKMTEAGVPIRPLPGPATAPDAVAVAAPAAAAVAAGPVISVMLEVGEPEGPAESTEDDLKTSLLPSSGL